MICKSKQAWVVGSLVNVGFITGLQVLAMVKTPGDHAPDAYLLSRNGQFYSFVPHNGLSKIGESEARHMASQSKAQAARTAADAIAKAGQSAAHADLVAQLLAA